MTIAQYPDANGASVTAGGVGYCYAEMGMTDTNNSTDYETTFFSCGEEPITGNCQAWYDESCTDANCADWASTGECTVNPDFMLHMCPVDCNAYINTEPDCATIEGACAVCVGNCASDDDCAGNLKCLQRDGDEEVPGCGNGGTAGWNYCYHDGSTTYSSADCTATFI